MLYLHSKKGATVANGISPWLASELDRSRTQSVKLAVQAQRSGVNHLQIGLLAGCTQQNSNQLTSTCAFSFTLTLLQHMKRDRQQDSA